MQADTPQVEQAVQSALADESSTQLRIWASIEDTTLTENDARRIIACLENLRFDTLHIFRYDIHNPAVLNAFRNGLPLCTSLTTVKLHCTQLGNEGLECLLPAFCNTSLTSLHLFRNNTIQGRRGGELMRDLLRGNNSVVELILEGNPVGPEGSIGLGQGCANNNHLQKLNLCGCIIGNNGLANLLVSMGKAKNNSLTNLDLSGNNIEGEEGGRKLTLLLQCFPALIVLNLDCNNLGPLGAHALAPGLAAASHLEELELQNCGVGNDGVANLVPDGQVNRSLTRLDLSGRNDIRGTMGGENVLALASRCTNLDHLHVYGHRLNPDQRRHLELLLDRKRLYTAAQALGGSTFPILFRAMEEAHHHEHGLSAIFVILQNDGEDYFCIANNRAMD